MRLLFLFALLSVLAEGQTTVTLRPTADGTVKQWTNNAGTVCTSATCYTEVNETSGSTNCSSNSRVAGSGVVNKSPATSARVEQYVVSLASIPNNALIQSMSVASCQARGGSNNTASTLRIVLNGATTTCVSTITAGASYAGNACTFGPLNVVKTSGTTLEIGNATTQARAVWMDNISVDVTYIQQAAGSVAAAFGTSPVPDRTPHTYAPQVGDVTGAFASAPACCSTMTSPLGVSIGVSPDVTGTVQIQAHGGQVEAFVHFVQGISAAIATSGNPAATVAFADSVTGVRGVGAGVGLDAAASVAPACCATSTFPLGASIGFIVDVSASKQTTTSATADASLGVGVAPVVTGVGGLGKVPTATCSLVPATCAVLSSPLAATFQISPAVAASKATNLGYAYPTLTLTTSPVCSTCVSKPFDTAHFTITPTVTVFHGLTNKQVTAAAQISPVSTTSRGMHTGPTTSFEFSLVVANAYVSRAGGDESFLIVPVVTAVGSQPPVQEQAVALVSFGIATQADEVAESSNGTNQAVHFTALATAKSNNTKSQTATVAFNPVATALVRQPKPKFVMTVAH